MDERRVAQPLPHDPKDAILGIDQEGEVISQRPANLKVNQEVAEAHFRAAHAMGVKAIPALSGAKPGRVTDCIRVEPGDQGIGIISDGC
jgi:hypothetical protein